MKYRHGFHAGNFADVHKHVALLTLLRSLKRKHKGFLYLDSHAGRGRYDLSSPTAEAAAGIGRVLQAAHEAQELRDYATLVAQLRTARPWRHAYPGSPLIALAELRPQDRAVFCELERSEAHALETTLGELPQPVAARARVVRGDGFAQLRALLPPPERRGLMFLDPPYEASDEPAQLLGALADGLRRFPTGVFAAWYAIKEARSSEAWLTGCARTLPVPLLVSELWLFPRDSRVALNGSGLLIANAPYLIGERMQAWLPELQSCLAVEAGAGSLVRTL